MERLTAQDMSMLWPDEFGWPQDIGVLAVLDGRQLVDTDGQLRIDDVRQAVGARLHLVPRFRQLLHVPRRGLGWPLWVDDPHFDLENHVRVQQVPAPGDEPRLLRVVEQLNRRRLDRSRPLWQMWVLPGLPEGRVGLFVKAHHTIADGVAGVGLLKKLLDVTPDAPRMLAVPWRPESMPTPRDLLVDNVKRRANAIRRALSGLTRPMTGVRRLRELRPWAKEIFGQKPAPRTSFNRPIGPDRMFAVIRADLGAVKAAAHTSGATVNDVLMAAITGGLHDFLCGRRERVEDVVLRAVVPVSLHRETGQAQGNVDGAMFVSLPIDVPDPAQCLRMIAAETTERKKYHHPAGGALLRSGLLQRIFTRHMGRQRWVNVYVANLPGPKVRLHLAGAPLVRVFPVVPLTGNLALGVGALSYAGQFNITVVADPSICPDFEVFAEGLRRTLETVTGTSGQAQRNANPSFRPESRR